MKYIIILIIFAVAAYYTTGKLKSNNPQITMYVTWVTTLITVNLLVSTFIYMFTHSVKNSQGNKGIRGKVGRRGPEGKPDFCNFCTPN
tara:strand:- start:3346 stop:3609 length:264 start_codon:yes stop_codon:yes gene_type:complete